MKLKPALLATAALFGSPLKLMMRQHASYLASLPEPTFKATIMCALSATQFWSPTRSPTRFWESSFATSQPRNQ